jgi:acyl-CoA thioesterase I
MKKTCFSNVKRRIPFVLALACLIGLNSSISIAQRVACVGDSGTEGYGLGNQSLNSYPAQLGRILKQVDNHWETRNFGHSGATVIKKGDMAYTSKYEYELALEYEPDVVVFQFGGNASRSPNRGFIQEHFLSDYSDLIRAFAQLPSKPKIVVCLPPAIFSSGWTLSPTILEEQILPLIVEVASTWNATLVDFYGVFKDLPHLYQNDKVHPSVEGAKLMAEMVSEVLLGVRTNTDFNGDGTVDTLDMHIMVDHWGRNDPLYDIAPTILGDGIVDMQDLIALTVGMEPVDTRLVMNLRLDETKCDIANDSAIANDGILYGSPIWRPADGMVSGALQFDGIDDYIDTPFILDPTKQPFSVFVWINSDASGQTIIAQQGAFDDWLSIDSTGKLVTGLSFPTPLLMSDAVVTDGAWHHVGLVSDGSSKALYVDGVEAASNNTPPILPSTGALYIGAGKNLETASFFSGLIDDVRVYNQALEPDEIAMLAY